MFSQVVIFTIKPAKKVFGERGSRALVQAFYHFSRCRGVDNVVRVSESISIRGARAFRVVNSFAWRARARSTEVNDAEHFAWVLFCTKWCGGEETVPEEHAAVEMMNVGRVNGLLRARNIGQRTAASARRGSASGGAAAALRVSI